MQFSEAKEIRAFIVHHCPFGHKSRNLSRDMLRAVQNSHERFAYFVGFFNLAKDYEIEERFALELERAHKMALDYIETSRKEVTA